MRQTKKVVLFGLWFVGFFLVMRHLVAPMSGQDPIVVEATPAPVLGAATVADQDTGQPSNGNRTVLNVIRSVTGPTNTPGPHVTPSAAPNSAGTPAPTSQAPLPAGSPTPAITPTPSPSPTPSATAAPTPSPSPSPTKSPLFPTLPHIHLP
jgi:hypothetical protein